jgi:hypothetical protein
MLSLRDFNYHLNSQCWIMNLGNARSRLATLHIDACRTWVQLSAEVDSSSEVFPPVFFISSRVLKIM